MAGPPRPTVCLTMIVRDEAHIIAEALDSAAPHIDRWVIVDTGSTDDTVSTIERRMADHGIPGEIHHRPWRDFGTNRTESLRLADGQADYLWVLDADDLVTGGLDLTGLDADSYLMRYRVGHAFWRRQIFRSGLPWRYEGVLHEYPVCDAPATEERLAGDYEIHGRTLGARSVDPRKYERDAALLREVVARDPGDLRALFYLGQSLADAGRDAEAADVFARRAELGGWDEERCHALMRRAECLRGLGRPWAESLDSYLDAFEARPTRAEPLARIARHYREAGSPNLAYGFARRAAAMPYPHADNLFVDDSVYAWGARDEQAVCAYRIGRYAEALDLGTALLAGTALPDAERARVAGNRDSCVEPVRAARTAYPAAIVEELTARVGPPAGADVTVTIVARGDVAALERTLCSFLHCCEDLDRVARFVCVVDTPEPGDGRAIVARYPFVELIREELEPGGAGSAAVMNRLLGTVRTPLWLHLEAGWELFARGRIVDRAARILAADDAVAQVAFNRSYARTLADRGLVGGEVRAVGDLRYRLHRYLPPDGAAWARFRAELAPGERTNCHWPHFTIQPSLMDAGRLREVGPFPAHDFERAFAERYAGAGLRTAFFDEVTCLAPDADEQAPVGTGPALLSDLLPGTRVGELTLDVDPPWPVVAAAVTAVDGGLRLHVRTAIEDEEPLDHEVRLGLELDVEALQAMPMAPLQPGPFEVALADGVLRLDGGDGTVRLTVARDGGTAGASVTFRLAGIDEERPFGLARLGEHLVIVFGIQGERLALAVVDEEAVLALCEA